MTAKILINFRGVSTPELLRHAGTRLPEGRVSILAGHFLLVYDFQRNELVPLMKREFPDGATQEPLLSLTRDFPERTFSCGLDLWVPMGSSRSKILLLVDDDTLRLVQELPNGLKLSDLRQKFFRESPSAPVAYREEIARRGLSAEDIFESNSVRRASSVLPTNTYLFSERILRSRFRRKTRKMLASLGGFRFRDDPLTSSVIFESSEHFDSFCIIEGGGEQSCSGTALALMDIIRARRYDHLIWFLPAGCRESVSRAVVLAVRELGWFRSAFLAYETYIPGEESAQLRDGLFVGEV